MICMHVIPLFDLMKQVQNYSTYDNWAKYMNYSQRNLPGHSLAFQSMYRGTLLLSEFNLQRHIA